MPVYNGELYIEEAITSHQNQTFSDFELIILNDNSSDKTVSIIERLRLGDNRIILLNKIKNEGPANLRNEGIDMAQTEFIAFLDADDVAMPTRFEKQINLLINNPNLGLCGTWFTIFGNVNEKIIKHSIKHDDLKVQFLSSCGIGNSTVMLRKSMLGDLRFENKFIPAEDYGLWTKFIAKHEFCNIPESLVRYRWHSENISQTKEKNLRIAEETIKRRQLELLILPAINLDSIYFVNAVSLKRKQSIVDITRTIEASKILIDSNSKLAIYNHVVFCKHLNQTIIRTIRNSNENNFSFYKFIKKESGYFKTMNLLGKLIFFLKSVF
jgi:glycosyltransferase involved in cell wall biosynthesis